MNTIIDIKKFHHNFNLQGFTFWGGNIGLKNNALDFGVIFSMIPAISDAVFTQNRFPGAPILVGRKHIRSGLGLQGIVVNSKNANTCTGKLGERNALLMCKWGAQALGIKNPKLILPSSTGVIGKQLNMEKIKKGFHSLSSHLLPDRKGLEMFSQAIMTSDAYPKWGAVRIGKATLVGVAKGAGMIEPNMATMLAYFLTDAQISLPSLRKIFREGVDQSFHAITVDGDTSTSDTAVILANGLAGKVNLFQFKQQLLELMTYLAQLIVTDGEGAQRLIEIQITHARSCHLARAIAKSVLNSPLVKTAVYGADPNWGRLIMAIGKVERKWVFNANKIRIYSIHGKHHEKILLNNYNRTKEQEIKVSQKLKTIFSQKKIVLEINLGNGKFNQTFWGSDLGVDYVKYNSDYTS